ncbi:MAG TPA: cobyric acid synthase, partial [Arenibaculum sp.]|nr:cobyric acid synthase [Arenibaculum sp.]
VAADLAVLLVGDIDRGGVIASLVGTHVLLPEPERARLKGFLVNKFRGDPSLFDEGMRIVEAHTGMAPLGIVPWFERAGRLPAEDALALASRGTLPGGRIKVAVPMLSRIANFDDLDPLRLEADVTVEMVPPGHPLPGDADLVILPGSKATIADLAFLRAQGWDVDLIAHARRGGRILGICGGLQMLGRRIADPDGIEGPPGDAPGLNLLDVETDLTPAKTLAEVTGRHRASGERVRGYEMHIGRTAGPALDNPFLDLAGRPEGACSPDGRILGTYVHGLFAADAFRHAFLSEIRTRSRGTLSFDAEVESTLDALADHLDRHVDADRLLGLAGEG